MSDAINPDHYKRFPVEVIDLTEHLNFCLVSAVKYIARAGHKPGADEVEDLQKAAWYIDREISRLTKQQDFSKLGTDRLKDIKERFNS